MEDGPFELDHEEFSEPDETTLENVLYLLGGDAEVDIDAAEIPESSQDELDESFLGLELDERLSEISRFLRSREETRTDAVHLEKLGRILRIKPEVLVDIYEDRGFSLRALEELVYLTLRIKDRALGPNQPLEKRDLEQVAEELLPSQVRETLNEITAETLMRMGLAKSEVKLALGMDENEDREWLSHLTEKTRAEVIAFRDTISAYERGVRGLYLIAWLADQDFMHDYDARTKHSLAVKRRTVAEMLNKGIATIDGEGYLFVTSRRKEQNRRIDFNRTASIQRYNRMVIAKRMCELIALGRYRSK